MLKQLDLFGAIEAAKGAGAGTNPIQIVDESKMANTGSELTDSSKEMTTIVGEPVMTLETASELPVAKMHKRVNMGQPEKKSKRGRKSMKEMDAEGAFIDIPEDEILFSRQYYSIGEVAAMFRANTSLVRYWETEFDILNPRKNRKGDRLFRPEDIRNLHLIYHLLRQKKYTIEGAKVYLRENHSKARQDFEIVKRLQKLRSFLLELKTEI
jgi:DNA-binding transcriptional MerR regulator